MNARKHLAGFAVFSIILGSAILINNFLTIPYATISRVERPAPVIAQERQPVTCRVRQISLDYLNNKSYTELSLFRQPNQPVPDRVWVTTTYFSPDATRAEDWTTTTEIRQPFARGNGQVFVATAEWDLPPRLKTPGDGYFARVTVSSESEGNFSPPDYESRVDVANIPVVIHWPDKKLVATIPAKKFSR